MVAIGSGEELHKPFEICTSMDMCFPNSIFIDDLLTLSTGGTDSHRRHQPLLPPPQNPFHHQVQSSTADISSHNFSPRPSADLTADYLSIPNKDDVAELEWLSQFVDNCFHDDFPTVGETMVVGSSVQRSDTSFTSKADHRRRLRAASGKSRVKAEPNGGSYAAGKGSGMRRCSHCAAEKTPQWRRGPLGPKTLCNACGVRYKSGRLLPEYRPASSPTFVLSQHSNSHRRVQELRRQKELELMKHSSRGASPSPE